MVRIWLLGVLVKDEDSDSCSGVDHGEARDAGDADKGGIPSVETNITARIGAWKLGYVIFRVRLHRWETAVPEFIYLGASTSRDDQGGHRSTRRNVRQSPIGWSHQVGD